MTRRLVEWNSQHGRLSARPSHALLYCRRLVMFDLEISCRLPLSGISNTQVSTATVAADQ